MIKNPLLSKKYAKGLYEAVKGAIDLTLLEKNLAGKEQILSKPGLSLDELISLCGFTPQPQLKTLMKILLRRKRQNLLSEIAKMYRMISEETKGIKRAELVTAVPIATANQKKIEKLLCEKFGAKKVIIESRVDTSIIGGIKIKFGDVLMDGSILTPIETFAHQI